VRLFVVCDGLRTAYIPAVCRRDVVARVKAQEPAWRRLGWTVKRCRKAPKHWWSTKRGRREIRRAQWQHGQEIKEMYGDEHACRAALATTAPDGLGGKG
jgi:hypothetical protein